MGKGLLDYDDPHALGTVGLQSRDYAHGRLRGRRRGASPSATTSSSTRPRTGTRRRDKKIVCIDSLPAEIDEYFMPEVELVGDIYHMLTRLAEECRDVPALRRLAAPARRRARALRGRPRTTTPFPMQPPRALWEIRQALGRQDILISRRRAAQAVDRAHVPGARAQHRADRQRPGGHGLRAAGGDRGQARAPRAQGRDGQRRRRLPDELPGARDRDAPEDAVRQRHLGEPPVRLDRLEAGQEVRPPLRRRLHQPRLRAPGRVLRHAGVALRVGRRLRPRTCATRSRSTCRR